MDNPTSNTTVEIDVQEVLGEAGDPSEQSIKLVLDKGGLPGVDVQTDLQMSVTQIIPGLTVLAIAPTLSGGTAVDVQEETGEESDPSEANIEIATTKEALGVAGLQPTITGTLYQSASGWALVAVIQEA